MYTINHCVRACFMCEVVYKYVFMKLSWNLMEAEVGEGMED